ncbi:hypothetical protein ACET3Z_028998 [Daucus carota]
MAEKQEQEALKNLDNESKPSFVEVVCKSSGKVRRFASGTDAGFATVVTQPHKPKRTVEGNEGSCSEKKESQPLGHLCIGKIALALLIVFVIWKIFLQFLQNLPLLLLYIHNGM